MAKWVCTVCGYVYEGEQAPEACPVCKAPASKFQKRTEELATLLKAAIIDDVDYQILHDDVKEFIDTLIIRQFVEA